MTLKRRLQRLESHTTGCGSNDWCDRLDYFFICSVGPYAYSITRPVPICPLCGRPALVIDFRPLFASPREDEEE